MFLLFELVMRYVDYKTFLESSKCNKECLRICKKLVPELKKIKKYDNYYETYEVLWKGQRQGLCYFINDSYLKIIDFDNGEKIASYHYSYFTQYFEFQGKKYWAIMDYETKLIKLPQIEGYYRKTLSLVPLKDSSYFR